MLPRAPIGTHPLRRRDPLKSTSAEHGAPSNPVLLYDCCMKPPRAPEIVSEALDFMWCAREELNPRPSGSKPDALSN
jgi:hypothetical protein